MPSLHKADKVAELAEESCDECFDLNCTDVFSTSTKNLSASSVSKELNADKVEYDMCQGEKVGASAVGELNRMKDKVKLKLIPVDCNSQFLHLSTIGFISLLLGCNKSFT